VEADGMPVTETNLSLLLAAYVAAVLDGISPVGMA
jgi:hypothetical protein